MSDSEEADETRIDESAELASVFDEKQETDEEFIEKFQFIQYRESTKRVYKKRDTLLFCAIAIAAALFVWTFLIAPQEIVGDSMKNTLQNDDIVILSKIATRWKAPKRYDMVVAEIDGEDHTVVKRVIALPGEAVFVDESGRIHVYPGYQNGEYQGEEIILKEEFSSTCGYHGKIGFVGEPLCLSEDEYLILGDNRAISKDSRSFGPVHKKNIIGKIWIRVLPLKSFGRPQFQSVEESSTSK